MTLEEQKLAVCEKLPELIRRDISRKIYTMKPEIQRIKIAEACGWKNVHWYEDNAGPPILSGEPPPTYKKRHRYDSTVPDYLNDLNAIREAENILSYEQRQKYWKELFLILTRSEGSVIFENKHIFHLIHASAAQRVEAFLRAIDMWDN